MESEDLAPICLMIVWQYAILVSRVNYFAALQMSVCTTVLELVVTFDAQSHVQTYVYTFNVYTCQRFGHTVRQLRQAGKYS